MNKIIFTSMTIIHALPMTTTVTFCNHFSHFKIIPNDTNMITADRAKHTINA
ncbi:MAG: hypothetical protein ISR80_04510 [Nitrosopumilus sp.]|nr:hypothetical protein [Nitrosopumilus sp.]